MKKIIRINGNGQPYTTGLPTLLLKGTLNDTAIQHIFENTGLAFKPVSGGYEAKPTKPVQIATLFMTYNFKTRYYNNWMYTNTLMLKHDHHIGFDVDSICPACARKNHIPWEDAKEGQMLSC